MLGQGDCAACLLLAPEQWKQLAMPTYKLRKEKKSCVKSDILIVPSQVSVVGPVAFNQSAVSTPSNVSVEDPSLKKEPSDLKDEWSTRFARIKALLTMGSNPLSALPVLALVFSPVNVQITLSPSHGFCLPHLFCRILFPLASPPSLFSSRTGISPGTSGTSG